MGQSGRPNVYLQRMGWFTHRCKGWNSPWVSLWSSPSCDNLRLGFVIKVDYLGIPKGLWWLITPKSKAENFQSMVIQVVASNSFFIFTQITGDMIQFDAHIFQMGWNHQLAMFFVLLGTRQTTGRLGWCFFTSKYCRPKNEGLQA